MYTDDEVEKVRGVAQENPCQARGKKGKTSVKKLLATFFVSFVGMLLILYLSLGTGSSSVVVSGAGGFYAEFEEINASGAFIYPAVTQTATCQSTVGTSDGRPQAGDTALPTLRVDLDGASIPANNKVRFIKSINTPAPQLIGLDRFSVIVQQGDNPGPTQLDNTTIFISELEGESLGLGETVVNETFSLSASNDPGPDAEKFGPSVDMYFRRNNLDKNMSVLGEFVIKGDTAQVINGEGIAHSLAFESLDISDVNFTVVYNQFSQYAPSGGCPV